MKVRSSLRRLTLLIRADPALVSSEGDKTVIRVSESFNVLSLGFEHDKELQSIFCPPFR